jgi:YbbR domain-containing protein
VKRKIRAFFTENLSYKMVSLFIALILWITILGRRDFVVAKKVDVELIPPPGYSVVFQSVDTIKIKVSGPRTALRRFIENGVSQIVTLDLSSKGPGRYEVEIPRGRVDVPFGVKLMTMQPEKIEVQIDKK